MKKICVLIVLISHASIAQAAFSGSEMLSNCTDALGLVALKNEIEAITDPNAIPRVFEKAMHGAVCFGFVNGAIDAFNIGTYKGAKLPFVIPKNVEIQQLVRVYIKYLEEHPEKLHLNSTDLLYMSLEEAFPRIK